MPYGKVAINYQYNMSIWVQLHDFSLFDGLIAIFLVEWSNCNIVCSLVAYLTLIFLTNNIYNIYGVFSLRNVRLLKVK